MKEKFKISNIDPFIVGMIWFVSFFIFICVVMLLVQYVKSAAAFGIGSLMYILTIAVPLILMHGCRSEIGFDGRTVTSKNMYGTKEIDLNKVKTVRYFYERGMGRYRTDIIRLEFDLAADADELYDPRALVDKITEEQISSVMKGDRSSVPLIRLYDRIIEIYPMKAAEGDDRFDDPFARF